VLLPTYPDPDRREAYRLNYERIAEDDLRDPIVSDRFDLMHRLLVDFIGDVRGQAVLDVGSAHASYLSVLEARLKVAVDLALPYLREIPVDSGIVRICGDAEYLPVRPERFDVVIISDVLEHLLAPESLVSLLATALSPRTRVIVHVPWHESLSQYDDAPYEFVHLRSFDDFSLRNLFWAFDVRRERSSLPLLTEPAVFRLRRFLPRRVFNALAGLYFMTELSEVEYKLRERWIRELPRREGWLLRLYPPQVKLFELHRRASLDRREDRLARMMESWSKRLGENGRATQGAAPEAVVHEELRR
jgi:SAM-dependent methyltransferase